MNLTAQVVSSKCSRDHWSKGNVVNKHITEKNTGNFVTNIWKFSSAASSSSFGDSIWKASCERQWRISYNWWTKYRELAPHSAITARRVLCLLSGTLFPPLPSLEDRCYSRSKSFYGVEWMILNMHLHFW